MQIRLSGCSSVSTNNLKKKSTFTGNKGHLDTRIAVRQIPLIAQFVEPRTVAGYENLRVILMSLVEIGMRACSTVF